MDSILTASLLANLFGTIENYQKIDNDTLKEYCSVVGLPNPHSSILQRMKQFYNCFGYLPEDLEIFSRNILSNCTCGVINPEDIQEASLILSKLMVRENRIPVCTYVSINLEFYRQEGRIATYEELSNYINNLYRVETDPEQFHQEEKLRFPTPNLDKLHPVKCCKEDNCGLCMDEIKKDQECFQLNCGHIFHSDSDSCIGNTIKKWLSENKSCPLCKREVIIPTENKE